MTLQVIKCTDFRCLRSAELAADPQFTLICGPNASGKTSILEAVAYLGRGRSFRGASAAELVRHGTDEFVLFGRVDNGVREVSLGVRNSKAGVEIQVDGQRAPGAARLAEELPLQVIDPDVHELIAGGPEMRRRYIDWIAFHVEHGYLELWRRFRRALKQRNAALKNGGYGQATAGWDKELAETGELLHEARTRVLEISMPALEEAASALLDGVVELSYQRGWAADKSLAESLAANPERELQAGSTQSGPQRADLRLDYEDHRAKKKVSRGQQKLLACVLVLAATEVVQTHLERPLLLLLDDPAAELDGASLERLMATVCNLGCQVIATSLQQNPGLFPEKPRLFHVEQGQITSAD